VDADGRFVIRRSWRDVMAASERHHAAPVVVLGQDWSFGGAGTLPLKAPSDTKGMLQALPVGR
jgi:hypothetical protein